MDIVLWNKRRTTIGKHMVLMEANLYDSRQYKLIRSVYTYVVGYTTSE